MSVCPLSVLGVGTWQLVASDRVLQGVGTNSVGTTVEAGLPNITGTFSRVQDKRDFATGCFYRIENINAGDYADSARGISTGFNASLSNSIYGNSTTVQPPAYIVNIWERIS